jgi:hypothetical protein
VRPTKRDLLHQPYNGDIDHEALNCGVRPEIVENAGTIAAYPAKASDWKVVQFDMEK